MTDIMAAIGLVELRRYENDTLPKRKAICDYYYNTLKTYPWAEVPVLRNQDSETSYHLFQLRIKGITEEERDLIIQRIFDEDVSVNVHFIPLPRLSFYKNLGYQMENYPVAYDNFSREISLPVFYALDEHSLKRVTDAVIKAVQSVLK
jgi:dTDP-4-amino-4,6-dideoxygalactose transaminase